MNKTNEDELRRKLLQARKETALLEQLLLHQKFEKSVDAFCNTLKDDVFNIISKYELRCEDARLFAKLLSGNLDGFYKHVAPKIDAARNKRSRKRKVDKVTDSYASASIDAGSTDSGDTSSSVDETSQRQY